MHLCQCSSTMACSTFWTICIFLVARSAIAYNNGDETWFEDAASYDPDSSSYDYIIVGGGTAGCPLAATLSKKFKVLLLERGGSPYGNPNITSMNNVGANIVNQGTHTPVQGFVPTDGVANVRARVLGGGSSINVGFYNRASPDQITRMGLDGSLVNSSFRWVERVVASFRSIGPYQTAFRNSSIQAGVLPDNGASFVYQVGTQTAPTIFDEKGTRRPASNLLFAYAKRNNLIVLLHAEVQLILLQGTPPRVRGVQYRDRSGTEHNAFLNSHYKSEVILSAGTLGSTQLLLLSGIGAAAELQSMGINVKVDLPAVGTSMVDNPAIRFIFPSPPPEVDPSISQVVGITAPFGNVLEAASGLPVAPLIGTRQGAFIIEKVVNPLSAGKLVLQSRNVTDTPSVTFNYFMHPQDLEGCISGVSKIEEIVLASSFRRYVFENQTLPSGGTIGAPNRRQAAFAGTINTTLARYCEENVTTMYHYHGGCLKGQVVDSDYAVMGTKGLRVVDGSTFDYSPGTNPQATLMMLGRYVGIKIIKNRA